MESNLPSDSALVGPLVGPHAWSRTDTAFTTLSVERCVYRSTMAMELQPPSCRIVVSGTPRMAK